MSLNYYFRQEDRNSERGQTRECGMEFGTGMDCVRRAKRAPEGLEVGVASVEGQPRKGGGGTVESQHESDPGRPQRRCCGFDVEC